jgi:DNA-binding NarL/FixJ family response regulator
LCAATLNSTASPVNRLTSLVTLGLIRARRDDASGWTYLDEASSASRGTAESVWIAMAGLARVEAHWLAADDEAARAELASVSEAAAHDDAYARGAYAIWLRRTGSTALPSTDGIAEACALTVAGSPAAAAAWQRLGCRYESALAMLDVGDEASTRAALRALEDLGATAAARRARHQLRSLGARSIPSGSRAATRAHPRGLTGREQQVLDLIRIGRTNAQICAQLVISERTVDHHVSAVLRKLGVSSRAMAAAEADRLGLASPGK